MAMTWSVKKGIPSQVSLGVDQLKYACFFTLWWQLHYATCEEENDCNAMDTFRVLSIFLCPSSVVEAFALHTDTRDGSLESHMLQTSF